MKASDAMTSPAITINQDATLREAGDVLARRGISALPVVDDEGQLVGILSQMDLIRFNTAESPHAPETQSPSGWLAVMLHSRSMSSPSSVTKPGTWRTSR
jgi:CBS-domain-containing membrane protein